MVLVKLYTSLGRFIYLHPPSSYALVHHENTIFLRTDRGRPLSSYLIVHHHRQHFFFALNRIYRLCLSLYHPHAKHPTTMQALRLFGNIHIQPLFKKILSSQITFLSIVFRSFYFFSYSFGQFLILLFFFFFFYIFLPHFLTLLMPVFVTTSLFN